MPFLGRGRPRRLGAGALLALATLLFFPEVTAGAQERAQLRFDRRELESVEDASEQLANDLLDLSVALRRQDLDRAGGFFAKTVQTTLFPAVPLPAQPEMNWISRHGWLGSPSQEVSVDQVLGSLVEFLSHFRDVEDVRLKVKGAEFAGGDPVSGTARVFFFLVGRDVEGKREWVTGYANIRARRATGLGPWSIDRLDFEPLSSLVSQRELFSEISAPAGLWEEKPAFGVPPNDGFVAHGVAVGDVDEDGLLDVFTPGVSTNRLWLGTAGGAFRDVSEETLVSYSRPGTGALFFDYDHDGDQDLFLAAVGNQILLQNQFRPTGKLGFVDVSIEAGVDVPAIGFSVAAADVDNDGWTDVYVASYNLYGQVMPDSWSRAQNGTPNLLFINQGNGRFREEAEKWGVADRRWSYASAFADLDGDGRQDLYVANDFGENALFMNRGRGFVDEAAARGVLDPGNGMGVSFGDFDNDGDLDLHVTNMSSTAGNRILARLMPEATPDSAVLKKLAAGNSLFENRGDGHFRNVAAEAGGFSAGWAYGGGFFDFDNDGWEDAFTVNGFVSGKSMKDT
jgi:hypothetical protein